MLVGRDIVVLSDEWSGLPTSTIHLMRHFVGENRVFWFNLINRMPHLGRSDLRKVGRVLRQWTTRKYRHQSNSEQAQRLVAPHVVTPVMIPYFKPVFRRINRFTLRRAYDALSRDYKICNPIVLTTWPSAVDFLKSIRGGTKVYYCVDDWEHYPGLNAVDWRTMEVELVDHVDALVATSRDLIRKGRSDGATYYLPHGVDFDHFNSSRESASPITALEEIPQPIVGFFGLVSSWVDLGLITELSRRFPKVSFVVIGKSEVDLGALASRPNVYYIGPVPYAELPRYARYFQVGLIPFLVNPLTIAVNPLKLFEYYALGLPVLATRLPELEQVPGPIELASNPDEFCDKLRILLTNLSPKVQQEAVSVARQNTWRNRADQLSDFLESIIDRRIGGHEQITKRSFTADCSQ